MTRAALTLTLLGWALLYTHGKEWEVMDDFPYQTTCLRVRAMNVDRDIRNEIGETLAEQPPDNPMRQQAYTRAERRVSERYRCEWKGQ
jgi:hypothetical protein